MLIERKSKTFEKTYLKSRFLWRDRYRWFCGTQYKGSISGARCAAVLLEWHVSMSPWVHSAPCWKVEYFLLISSKLLPAASSLQPWWLFHYVCWNWKDHGKFKRLKGYERKRSQEGVASLTLLLVLEEWAAVEFCSSAVLWGPYNSAETELIL